MKTAVKMPLPNLFEHLDYQSDSLWIVKTFFNLRNRYDFTKTLEHLVNRQGGGDEYSGCIFPENLDEDDEPFEPFIGVLCWYFDVEAIISEQDFYNIMLIACQRYIQLHPTEKEEINRILAKWK